MRKVWWLIKRRILFQAQRGFSTVEALLAATVFGFLVVALAGALIYGRQSTAEGGNHSRAVLLAEEGTEAVRSIRNAAYTNLADGTYGLAQTGNTWAFAGSSDTTDIYNRSVSIASTGTTRKTVTSTVTWPQAVGTGSVSIATQLTNWAATIIKSWKTPAVGGGVDVTASTDAIKVTTHGTYAYLVRKDATPDFVVIDISNPASPIIVGTLSLAGSPTNIAVNGNYAYVTNTSDTTELQIVNIATATAPSLVGTYNAAGTADANGIYYSGGYVVICRSANGGNDEVVYINVGSPASPSRTSGYSLNVTMNEVYVNNQSIYVATGSDSQEIVQITIFMTYLFQGTTIDLPGTTDATTITGLGSLLFVGQGAKVYTASSGLLNSVSLSGTVNDITLNADASLAFVGTSDTAKEFQVIDAANSQSLVYYGGVNQTGTNILSGVAYSTTKDAVVGALSSDTQEGVLFVPGS